MVQIKDKFTVCRHSPYRYDVVGSFLRPEILKEARERFAKQEISLGQLTKVEDQTIIDLINKEESAGLKAITDGEFRRSWYHLDFFWGLQGVKKIKTNGWQLHDGTHARGEGAALDGELGGNNHPFIDHFRFVKDHVSRGFEVKQTIPSPALLLAQLELPFNLESTKTFYSNEDDLIKAIAAAYDQVLADLFKAGLKVVQFDDSAWSSLIAAKLVDHPAANPLEFTSEKFEELKSKYLKVNNLAIEGAPKGLVVNAHICRGNYKSNWAFTGSYAGIANPLFIQEKVNAFYLEYDTARDGGFEVLKQIPKDKWVVLGLVTSKDGHLEKADKIVKRIYEASQYFDLDHLCLSPQCGFASSEEGNVLTEKQQWDKISLIRSIATKIWLN
ncbi:5-methyltetrahydropteroyltriglutamate--homocysteine S-methyltransferase [Oenococcus oeni]|uniref:5-methyltetrahydropteroyltriglutamate-- homocysteine S-methyltransferase n=1 Tax=Oenococcus oeni TaxID=1247 RepID=UPI0010B61CD6|nr:5-methyltetrahydropteroyltriglutamate--homocysteine S-methyltransferase [Oenococcus oeni]SYW08498.1 putative Methionine synthase II (Cobalamin-independent) [Oenococcus oeni]